MSYHKISVPLSVDEQQLLRAAASRECRNPRDHARYIILRELGLTADQPTDQPTDRTRPVREK